MTLKQNLALRFQVFAYRLADPKERWLVAAFASQREAEMYIEEFVETDFTDGDVVDSSL